MRTKLAQLRANKLSVLRSHLNTIYPGTYTSQRSQCLTHTHHTNHLLNCGQVPSQHHATNLWRKPLKAAKGIMAEVLIGFPEWLKDRFSKIPLEEGQQQQQQQQQQQIIIIIIITNKNS